MIYSLIIGRFQPFHKGHQALIQAILNENKNVCVAVRDTKKDKNNPYSYLERNKMIKKIFPKVKVIKIPDIEEIIYGRKVGWGIREIRFNKEIENISATKIRNGLI